ncbi:MAG TPA: V-type ATP synthase subunit D [Actinomycetaceae bacterium]|nr:V-type ATP synthase subunit D [Actinomycetaceae bacterium]
MADTGRAGKVRIERRLEIARRGSDLLDRKQRIMIDELERLQLNADRLRGAWRDLAREAAVWLARAESIDGPAAVAGSSPAAPVRIEIRLGFAMGASYPVDAQCIVPDDCPLQGSSALVRARGAHRAALDAAVRHAAAERAVELVSAELDATRRRQSAVENRYIPRLETRLENVQRALDERELEESLRVHWAADAAPAQVGGP